MLGIAMTMNGDFLRDHQSFLLKFYEHTCKSRFLLKQEDKQVLSRLFTNMGIQKLNKKHLDLFQDVKGKEL